MDTLSIYSDARRVYPCPRCGEEVDTALAECWSCHHHLDPNLANRAAGLESKLSKASSSSGILRMVGGAALTIAGCGNFALIWWGRIRYDFSERQVGFCLLVLAVISLAISIFAAGLAISWFAGFGSLRFERLGRAQLGRMLAEYRKAKNEVIQGILLCAFALGISLLCALAQIDTIQYFLGSKVL
jgi:hypothetical protein